MPRGIARLGHGWPISMMVGLATLGTAHSQTVPPQRKQVAPGLPAQKKQFAPGFPAPKPPDPEEQRRQNEVFQRRFAMNQKSNLANELAKVSGQEPKAIEAARETIRLHGEPADDADDKLAIEAFYLIASLHARLRQTPEELAVRRELVAWLKRRKGTKDWRLTDATLDLSERQRFATYTPEQREQLVRADREYRSSQELSNSGRSLEALDATGRASSLYQAVLGEENRQFANSLVLRGLIHDGRHEYTSAAEMFERALELRKRLLGERHPDVILLLTQMAKVAEAQGDDPRAKRLFERALAIHRDIEEVEDAERARLLDNVGRLYAAQGDYSGARPFLEKQRAILELIAIRHSSNGLPFDYGGSMDRFGIGGGYSGLGLGSRTPRTTRDRPDLFGRERAGFGFDPFDRGRNSRRGILGGNDSSLDNQDLTAMARNPLHPWSIRQRAMQMYLNSQDPADSAINSSIRNLFGRDEIRGDRWVAYARSLTRLAEIARAEGDLPKARLLRLKASAIGLEATDPNEDSRADYAEFLDGFLTLIQEQGELPLAKGMAHNSIIARKVAWGDRHPAFAAGLDRLASVLWAAGDKIQATLLYEKALSIRIASLGEGHPDVASTMYHLALLLEDEGDRDEARRYAGRSLALSESLVMAKLPFLPERQRLTLLSQSASALSAFIDLTGEQPDEAREAYRHLVAWKGSATEAAAAQVAASATPELRAISDELSRARDELNRLYYANVPDGQAEKHALQIREQAGRRDALEGRLAEAIGWKPDPPSLERIAEALPKDAVLVDFTRYLHRIVSPPPEANSPKPAERVSHYRLSVGDTPEISFEARFAAFVVRSGQSTPIRLDLGPAEPIERAVMTWIERLENGGEVQDSEQQLVQLLWGPLAPHVASVPRILISPDGALNFLPWGALPGESGAYLLEHHAFGVVGAARTLTRPSRAVAPRLSGELLAVGGVDYSLAETAPKGPRLLAVRSAPIGEGSLNVGPLAGTLQEAKAVESLFLQLAGKDGSSLLLSGTQASKERVRADLAAKRYLHLATHGYFASPQVSSALAPEDRATSSRSIEGMNRVEVRGLYPGLLSGLIFAGANRPARDSLTGVLDQGSGVMTAEEIAGLDLSRCELAVLSACETGRGRIAGGEGVLGLQRAFHQAGAKTVVASLWKVNDVETQSLMARFYENLWREGLGPLEAMRQAQLAQISLLREASRDSKRGLKRPEPSPADSISESSPRPSTWAAWVVSGEPGAPLPPDFRLPRPRTTDTQAERVVLDRTRHRIQAVALSTLAAVGVALLIWIGSRKVR